MLILSLCIGMYFGVYCGMYGWCVLNTYQHVLNTDRYVIVFNIYQSVLVCNVLVLHTNWIKYVHIMIQYIPQYITIDAKYTENVLVCITILANTYKNVLFFSICANTGLLMLKPIHLPIWSQYNQTHINTSSNTDQHKLQYRPIHINVFNMWASTCQCRHWYCQIRCSSQHSLQWPCTLLHKCVRGIWPSKDVHFSCSRIIDILLFVARQFLGVLWLPKSRQIWPNDDSWPTW